MSNFRKVNSMTTKLQSKEVLFHLLGLPAEELR